MSSQQVLTDFKFTATEQVAQQHDVYGIPPDCLFIKFVAQQVSSNYFQGDDGGHRRIFFNPRIEGVPRIRYLIANYNHLLSPSSRTIISGKLNEVGIPRNFHWRILQQTRSAALRMARGAPHVPLRFDMLTLTARRAEKVDNKLIAKFSDLSEEKPVKTRDIEDVMVNEREWSSADVCPICWEEIFKTPDQEVKRLPCSHVYHGSCIIGWLEERHVCPMCRYEMPTGRDFTIFADDENGTEAMSL